MKLETKRLILRETTPEDVENMFRLHSNVDVQKYTGDKTVHTIDEIEKMLTYKEKEYQEIGFGRWVTILKEGNQFVGWAGLKYLDDINEVDLGYRFLPEYWGMGIATEASKAILEYGFNKLNLKKIIALAIPENKPSVRVMEKVGMEFDKIGPYESCGIDTAVWYKIEK